MTRLINFELKRSIRSYVFVMSIILSIGIGILGVVLNYVFYNDSGSPTQCMISIFNSYTQFTYLILGFMFIQIFAKDYARGVVYFYKQQDLSIMQQYLAKTIVLLIMTIPIIDLFVIASSLFYRNNDYQFLLGMLIAIDFSTIYIILLAALITALLKNVVKSVLVFLGLFVLFNILNLFGYGLINPADGNSIVTYSISLWAQRSVSHYTLNHISDSVIKYTKLITVLVPLIWSLLLGILNWGILLIKNKKL